MKKLPLLLICILLLNTVFSQKQIAFSEIEKKWISEQDTVYFGYDSNWKPYQFMNEKGEHDGIIESIIKILREETQLNLQPYPNLDWTKSIEALKNNKVQFLPLIGVTEEKLEYMNFSDIYMSFPFVIIDSKNHKFIGDISNLKGLKIALPRDYQITEKIERNHPEIEIITTNSVEESLLLILTKKADATISALPVASYYLNYKGFDQLQIAGNVNEYNMNLNVSVIHGNEILLNILNKTLNSISEKKKQNIINEWVTVKYEHGVNMKRVWKIAGYSITIILLVIIVIMIWNRSLKKEIIRREKAEKQLQVSLAEIKFQKELVDEKSQEITDSIIYAKRIQKAILPPHKLIETNLKDSFVIYKPKDIVAGDFYWLEPILEGVLFAVADCTGHGVPGAMVSVICNSGLNRSVREFGLTEPGEILDNTRKLLIQEFEKSEEEVKDGMDIAICYLKDMTLKYAGANNPLWIIPNGARSIESIVEYKADKQPIGKYANEKPFTTHTIELVKGDSIYIFSDGFVDQFGGIRGKKFKANAFRNLLISVQGKPMNEQKKSIDTAFENWKGDLKQIDDVCVIGVKI